jgi:hypothetical protein
VRKGGQRQRRRDKDARGEGAERKNEKLVIKHKGSQTGQNVVD